MSDDCDFLDEVMEESTALDPAYPQIYAAALERSSARHAMSRAKSHSMLPKSGDARRSAKERLSARGQSAQDYA